MMNKTLMMCVLFFFTFHIISPVHGTPSYSAEEVWTKLNSGDSILLIDTRENEQYVEGHIPTAINIPSSGSVNQSTINVINNYNWSEVIAYCSCENGESAKLFIDSVLDYNLQDAFYMHNDFRYWPYSIATGKEPGTLNISYHNTSSTHSSINSPNIEPFLIINVVLGIIIIYFLIRKQSQD